MTSKSEQNKYFIENFTQSFFVLEGPLYSRFCGGLNPKHPHRGLRLQTLDVLGLELKQTDTRVLLVNVSESS